jgi:hypothetical protein
MDKILVNCKSIAAVTEHEKTPDLLSIEFILCHELDNENRDVFLQEVLESAQKTPIHKYINWNHDNPCFGTITDSEFFFDDVAQKNAIKCKGFLWKFQYPELCKLVEENYKSGKLKMSMECYFPNCFYVESLDDLYNESKRISQEEFKKIGYTNKDLYRVFEIGTFFGGAGVVSDPADNDAWILSVAHKENPIKVYHDRLHFLYENEIYDVIPLEVLIKEHRRLHKDYREFLN